MGKSPAKWLKTILLGKKASKSNSSKGKEALKATTEKETSVAAKEPTNDFPVDPPSVSEPITSTTIRNEGNVVEEKESIPDFPCDDGGALSRTDVDKQGTTASSTSHDPERIRLEQAAIKAQAAFRGYLARRAFHALKGIIKLQALIRGHLVRRQAVATLRCLQGIVKLQALVRAHKVKLSGPGFIPRVKLSENSYVSKLLRSSPTVVAPLRLKYDLEEPNSTWNWLDRWTSSRVCESITQQKKVGDSKSQLRQDQGRSKRTIRKVVSDNGVTHSTSETEKPKRTFKKSANHSTDITVQETPENELEKVKRSLRKVSSSNQESNDRLEAAEIEKPKRILRKPSNPQSLDVPDKTTKNISISTEIHKSESNPIVEAPVSPSLDMLNTPTVPKEPDLLIVTPDSTEEMTENIIEPDIVISTPQPLELDLPLPPLDLQPSSDTTKKDDENIVMSNGDNPNPNPNPKTSKRRASITTTPKEESLENGGSLQNSPTVPSYMAATASAKAKLRGGQGSPRLSQEVSAEKNGITRRHSLPSPATNGKMNSMSPRTQRLVHTNGKGGGVKNDKSLLASRDGGEKIVHAGWRR